MNQKAKQKKRKNPGDLKVLSSWYSTEINNHKHLDFKTSAMGLLIPKVQTVTKGRGDEGILLT